MGPIISPMVSLMLVVPGVILGLQESLRLFIWSSYIAMTHKRSIKTYHCFF